MKVGIITDTHDQMPLISKAIDIFISENVELVLHCGDWISPFTLNPFLKLKCPIKSVFGNNDGDKLRHLKTARNIGLDIIQEEILDITLDGRRIAVLHGENETIVHAMAKSEIYDVMFHGHSHQVKNEVIGKTLIVNAGSLIIPGKPHEKASIAIYDSIMHSARHIFFDSQSVENQNEKKSK